MSRRGLTGACVGLRVRVKARVRAGARLEGVLGVRVTRALEGFTSRRGGQLGVQGGGF